jgi:acetyl esterase/lipase
LRANTDRALAGRVAAMKERYPAQVEERTIAGVPTRVFKPTNVDVDEDRVLINLHGGAFQTCWESCSVLESLPIAVVGRWKVISVNYRQGPENVFPAASEDAANVYRSLLRDYRALNIGIYGCSAGGALTAEVVAWLQKERLPRPGAVGIFGASAGSIGRGDSAYLAAYVDGSFPAPAPAGSPPTLTPFRSYFDGSDPNDPLVSPLVSADVISKFPASLIVTATRAVDLSGSVYSHYQMRKQGVDAELLVAEAQGHCYMYDSSLPESRDAFQIITDFFDEHLGY